MKGRPVVQKKSKSPKCKLLGNTNEAVVIVGNRQCLALIDTGSMISNISESFYRNYLKQQYPLKDLDQLLEIEGASGQILKYVGYIEVDLKIPDTAIQLTVPLLVVPDTGYSTEIPLLIGTNVLKVIMEEEKPTGPNSIWKSSLDCLVSSFTNPTSCTVYTYREMIIPANQAIMVTGIVGGTRSGCGIVAPLDSLPGGLMIPLSAVEVERNKVRIQVKNTSVRNIQIPARQRIAQFEVGTILDKEEVNCKANQVQTMTGTGAIQLDLDTSCLTEKQKQEVMDRMQEWNDIFASSSMELGKLRSDKGNIEKHKIRLNDSIPFKEKTRRIPPGMLEEVRKHVHDMLACGAIRHSHSPWSSNIVPVRKKDGSLRLCLDFRKLNAKTIRDAYQLPRIEETLDNLAGARIFSSLDLQSGYWQIEMSEESKEMTAFSVPQVGFFECERLPFGLTNAPSTFQRVMERTLSDLSNCLVYIDDIIVYSKNYDEHWERLIAVFDRLKKAGFLLKPSKCKFFQNKVNYLGHVISEDGIEADPQKIEAIKNWDLPTTVQELRSAIGFFSYYRRFVKDFARIAKPLHELLKGHENKRNVNKKTTINMTPEAVEAFNILKEKLTTPPILGYADYSLPFEVHTDASAQGLGAILYQTQDEKLRVIAYASKSLKPSEMNYPAHKLEFLALKWALCDKFYDYLYGHHFSVLTDNNPLAYVLTTAKLDATGHRWLAELANLDFTITYRSGKQNVDADFLSRLPKEHEHLDQDIVKAVCNQLQDAEIICLEEIVLQDQGNNQSYNWRKLQQQDPVLHRLYEELERKQKPVGAQLKKMLKFSTDFKNYARNWEKLELRDGVMYRKKLVKNEEVYQLLLPKEQRKEALEGLHNKIGHMGRERTMDLVAARFYWPGMGEDVQNHLKNCLPCIKRKTKVPDRAPMIPIQSYQPMELVCIDYLLLERSKGGIENLLVITDHFTRFAYAIPTKNQTAKTTAKALQTFFLNYGFPQKLHSDQGRNFESAVIKELCKLTGVQKSRTTPYHPAGNGQCERLNQTLMNMLGTLEDHQKSNWKEYVPIITHAYNSTRHESTNYSPFYLMFGRHPRLPIDLAMGIQDNNDDGDVPQYVKQLKEKLEHAYKLASQEGERASGRHKKNYDRRVRGATVTVGDRVLVRKVALQGRQKLANKWEDHIYNVMKQPSTDIPVFVVKREDGQGRERTLHRNMLLPVNHLPIRTQETKQKKPEKRLRKDSSSAKATSTDQQESTDSDGDEGIYFLRSTLNPDAPSFLPCETVAEEEEQASEEEDQASEEEEQVSEEEEHSSEELVTETESLEEQSEEDHSESEEDENQTETDNVLPRRSTRIRRQPEWQRSGDYVFIQQSISNLCDELEDIISMPLFVPV